MGLEGSLVVWLVGRVYQGTRLRGVLGRIPVEWIDRVDKVLERERVRENVGRQGVEDAERECQNREDWRLLLWPSPSERFGRVLEIQTARP